MSITIYHTKRCIYPIVIITKRSRCLDGNVCCFWRRRSSTWGLNAAGIRELLDIWSTTDACAMLKVSTMPDDGPRLGTDNASFCYTSQQNSRHSAHGNQHLLTHLYVTIDPHLFSIQKSTWKLILHQKIWKILSTAKHHWHELRGHYHRLFVLQTGELQLLPQAHTNQHDYNRWIDRTLLSWVLWSPVSWMCHH